VERVSDVAFGSVDINALVRRSQSIEPALDGIDLSGLFDLLGPSR